MHGCGRTCCHEDNDKPDRLSCYAPGHVYHPVGLVSSVHRWFVQAYSRRLGLSIPAAHHPSSRGVALYKGERNADRAKSYIVLLFVGADSSSRFA